MALDVCLAGPMISQDRALIEALERHHHVSAIPDQRRLEELRTLDRSDVLVIDATGIRTTLHLLLRSIRHRRPDLPIVLIDGGLTEEDKVEAFSLGVLDYFPAPCHVALLAERLEVLARARRPPTSMRRPKKEDRKEDRS